MKCRHNELFKLPNNIFHTGLNATELTVLAAIYSLKSHCICNGKKFIKVNQKSIASICGFKTAVTVSRAVDKLCRMGFIERIDRYYVDVHKLGAYVYTLPIVKCNFFFVSRRVFKFKLTTAQIRLYLFCCKCAASHSKQFWNSYNDISQQLHIKRSAAIKTMSELIEKGLIKRYKVRKKDRSYSDNHYRIIELKPSKIKIRRKKRRCRFAPSIFLRKKIKLFYENIINLKVINVNTYFEFSRIYFFDLRGSPKIFRSLYSTHFYSIRGKNKIKLYLKYRCNLTIYELGH